MIKIIYLNSSQVQKTVGLYLINHYVDYALQFLHKIFIDLFNLKREALAHTILDSAIKLAEVRFIILI